MPGEEIWPALNILYTPAVSCDTDKLPRLSNMRGDVLCFHEQQVSPPWNVPRRNLFFSLMIVSQDCVSLSPERKSTFFENTFFEKEKENDQIMSEHYHTGSMKSAISYYLSSEKKTDR